MTRRKPGESLLTLVWVWLQEHWQQKQNIEKQDYLELKRLLHKEGTSQQNEKITYRLGENICKPYLWQEVNIQNI